MSILSVFTVIVYTNQQCPRSNLYTLSRLLMPLFRRSACLDRQQVQLYTAVARVPLHGRWPGHGFQIIRQCRFQVVVLARQFGPPSVQSPALHLGPGTPLPKPPHLVGILCPKVHRGNKGRSALDACRDGHRCACGRDGNRRFFAPKAFRFLFNFFLL